MFERTMEELSNSFRAQQSSVDFILSSKLFWKPLAANFIELGNIRDWKIVIYRVLHNASDIKSYHFRLVNGFISYFFFSNIMLKLLFIIPMYSEIFDFFEIRM